VNASAITTAAEISERAGYSRPMVRTRYGSKKGLLETILRAEYNSRLFSAPVAEATEQSGLDQLLALTGRPLEIGVEAPELIARFWCCVLKRSAHSAS
jgi:AcrR family transcriptional regulator